MTFDTDNYLQIYKDNEIMREVLDSDLAYICVKDLEGRFIYINQNDAALYNQRPQDMIGKTVEPYVGRKQFLEWLEQDNEIIKGGKPVHFDLYVRHDLQGKKIWFDTVKIPLKGQVGFDRLLVIHRDMTVLKESLQKNEKLDDQLYHSQKMEAVGTLAAGVAHNFNNLMMTILALTNKLQEEIQSVPNAVIYLNQIEKSIRHASEITRNMVNYAHQKETELEILEMGEVLCQVENLIRPGLSSRIKMDVTMKADRYWIEASRSELLQLFINLLLNAEEAITGTGQINVSVERSDNNVSVCINDNGAGIPLDLHQKIFDPFFTTKEVGRGTGLGLYYVYNIIQKYHGSIRLESFPGRGSTFCIHLPLCNPPASR
ncbi:MAG: ATP-binding protein [Verrucomicrobiota bacterium]|nr:ATP-binding protein [Verrucomicrobiota bacterium]